MASPRSAAWPRPPQVEFDPCQCLVCGKRATPFSSREVPELLAFIRGETGDMQIAAAALKAMPGVEGCLVAPGCGISICASRGVVR